jgi:hypothetical protein
LIAGTPPVTVSFKTSSIACAACCKHALCLETTCNILDLESPASTQRWQQLLQQITIEHHTADVQGESVHLWLLS